MIVTIMLRVKLTQQELAVIHLKIFIFSSAFIRLKTEIYEILMLSVILHDH
jgi:hypothetical protein